MKYEKLEQLILSAEDPGELIDDVIAFAEQLFNAFPVLGEIFPPCFPPSYGGKQ